MLIKSGRTRNLDKWVERLHSIFRADVLRHGPAVEDAYGHAALAALKRLDAAVTAAEELHQAATVVFEQHPRGTITSFPASEIGPVRGFSPNSAMTATATRTPARSRPTPGRRPSLAPPARHVWSCTGG